MIIFFLIITCKIFSISKVNFLINICNNLAKNRETENVINEIYFLNSRDDKNINVMCMTFSDSKNFSTSSTQGLNQRVVGKPHPSSSPMCSIALKSGLLSGQSIPLIL